MSKSSVVIMLFLLSLSMNVAHEVVADSDRIELKRLLDRIDANYDAIYSWQGMATIQRTAYRNGAPAGSLPREQYTKYTSVYAFDRGNGNFISTTQLHDEYSVYGKEKKHLALPNQNYMRRDQLCYKFNWHSPRNVETLASNGKNLFSSNGVFLHREALILTEPFKMRDAGAPGPTHLLFDPFVKSSFDAWGRSDCDHVRHTKNFRYLLAVMEKRKMMNFAEFEKEGSSTKLVSQNNQYRFESRAGSGSNIESSELTVFDLKQGGNVVESNHVLRDATGKVIQLQEWQCTYENVKGYWVPKRTLVTEYFEQNRSTETAGSTEIVDWHATVINEVIPDSVFTLQNLGLRRGDSVYDYRTESRTVITGDDFPPPFDHAQIPVRQSKAGYAVGSVLFFVGTFLVLLAIFRMYVIWRSNRKK